MRGGWCLCLVIMGSMLAPLGNVSTPKDNGNDNDDTKDMSGAQYVTVTAPPHPSWTPGEKQPQPFTDTSEKAMVSYSPSDLSSCYSLCISAVVPRPIAFVSTVSEGGVVNLAPYSYAGVVAHDPPTVIFSACRKPKGVKKDTLANVEKSGEFVLSFMSEWFVEVRHIYIILPKPMHI